MINAPDAVYVIIPCMKELGMSWSEIKSTPRHELVGLLGAMSNYNELHSFDGYTSDEVSTMSKDRPHVRSAYGKAMALKAKYEARSGKDTALKTFKDII